MSGMVTASPRFPTKPRRIDGESVMNFSAWAIRNPIAPLLAFGLLMLLGIHSFFGLPITRFPNIDVPIVSVQVTQAGAAPAELETQVPREVEDAVAGISGVDFIQSTVN